MVYLCFTIPRDGRVSSHTDALPVEHYTHHTYTHTRIHKHGKIAGYVDLDVLIIFTTCQIFDIINGF